MRGKIVRDLSLGVLLVQACGCRLRTAAVVHWQRGAIALLGVRFKHLMRGNVVSAGDCDWAWPGLVSPPPYNGRGRPERTLDEGGSHLSQPPAAPVQMSGDFCRGLIPGLWPMVWEMIATKLLQTRSIMVPPVLVSVFTFFVNIGLNVIFIDAFGFLGCPAATSVSLSAKAPRPYCLPATQQPSSRLHVGSWGVPSPTRAAESLTRRSGSTSGFSHQAQRRSPPRLPSRCRPHVSFK